MAKWWKRISPKLKSSKNHNLIRKKTRSKKSALLSAPPAVGFISPCRPMMTGRSPDQSTVAVGRPNKNDRWKGRERESKKARNGGKIHTVYVYRMYTVM